MFVVAHLLWIDGAFQPCEVRLRIYGTQEYRFKLVHPRIRKEQRRIWERNNRRGGNYHEIMSVGTLLNGKKWEQYYRSLPNAWSLSLKKFKKSWRTRRADHPALSIVPEEAIVVSLRGVAVKSWKLEAMWARREVVRLDPILWVSARFPFLKIGKTRI